MHVREQDRVDLLGRDAERRERRPASARRGAEELGGAGVDQQRPVAAADEMRRDRRPGSASPGSRKAAFEAASSSSGGMLTKKLGRHREIAVADGGQLELADLARVGETPAARPRLRRGRCRRCREGETPQARRRRPRVRRGG